MLKNIKNVRKIRNIILVLIAVVVMFAMFTKIWYPNFKIIETKSIAAQPFIQMKAEGTVTNKIELENGTMTPVYRPEWTKVGSTIDTANQEIVVTVKGNAIKNQDINSDVSINYNSEVTGSLENSDITVYINGVLDGDINKNGILDVGETSQINVAVAKISPTDSNTGEEVQYTITLSNFDEGIRRPGMTFRELSGNIKIKIRGREQAVSTYDEDVLVDEYGNQNMAQIDTTGTWIDVTYQDAETNQNTNGTMFTDFIKPEFTYEYSNTTIEHGVEAANEKVTVVFDVTDRYFSSTNLATDSTGNLITVVVGNDTTTNANITKALTRTAQIIMNKTTGAVTYETAADYVLDTTTSVKVGERYELVITGLDKEDGFTYSGQMTLAFGAGMITDLSGNTNDAKTITIGKNETDGNMNTDESGNAEIVDVVDPIWEVLGFSVEPPTMTIRTKDKYFGTTTLELEDLQVYVNGVISTDIIKSLTGPNYKKLDESGNYVDAANEEEADAADYLIELDNITPDGYKSFTPTNLETDNLIEGPEGFKYKAENGGTIKIEIAAGTAVDEYGNTSNDYKFDLGDIDKSLPEIYEVQKINNADNTVTVIFNITDRNYDPLEVIEPEEISLWLDGVQTSSITKQSLTYKAIKADLDGGGVKTVGYQYTLVLSDIVETQEELVATGRKYREISGDIEVKVAETAVKDLYNNTVNPLHNKFGHYIDFIKPEITYKYADSTQATPGSINYGTKTFTMVFDIIDKYFEASTLTSADQLTILIGGETVDWTKVTRTLTSEDIEVETAFNKVISEDLDNDGVLDEGEDIDGDGLLDVFEDVNKNGILDGREDVNGNGILDEGEDLNNNGVLDYGEDTNRNGQLDYGAIKNAKHVIGKRYTLTLEHLEELEIASGKQYADYSGVVTVAIPEGVATDTSDLGNNAKTITSGLDIFADTQEPGDGTVVDVVDPIWVKVSSSANAVDQSATVKVRVTDKYYASSTLTGKIKVYAQSGTVGAEATDVTDSVTIQISETPTPVYKTGTTEQIGDEYDVTITGFEKTINQVKIEIQPGAMTDQSGNTNKATEIIIYNALKLTDEETATSSNFLGITGIEREDVENVTFLSSTETKPETTFDVSAAQDGSIIAWYETNANGAHTVYIASDDEIFANQNSSYLFAHIGYGTTCAATQPITNLNLLNTSSVTNMSNMFWFTGYRTMTSLTLPNTFDTRYVTNMREMFNGAGYNAMTTLNLGTGFNTQNVTDMSWMLANTGYTAMTSMNLGANFNTTNVTDMSYMFMDTGHTAMTNIYFGATEGIETGVITFPDNFSTANVTEMDYMFNHFGYTGVTEIHLGNSFKTEKVTNMEYMFTNAGYTAMTTLDLGANFDTTLVTNMEAMFSGTGYTAMTSLDLKESFKTNSVINMSEMFKNTGYTAMITLDLGDLFNTSNVQTMDEMFANTGYTVMTSLDLKELFYTTSATDMSNMFNGCGTTAMTTLDLGPAFTRIADTNTDFAKDLGTASTVIRAPESIYNTMKKFKLNTDSETTITLDATTQGTINPVYKPDWTRVSTTLDEANKKISIVIKGNTNTSVYTSNVTSTLAGNLINVYIDGELDGDADKDGVIETGETTSITRTVTLDEVNSTDTELYYTITLSGFEETLRQSGKNFKEWSGNIAIQPLKGTIVDSYGNKNMEEIDDASGNWTNIEFKDTAIDTNTDGKLFADFIKPEFTYEYANTTIDYDQNDKSVTVVFDITDKYFKQSSISVGEDINENGTLDEGEDINGNGVLDANNITIIVDNDDDADAAVTKTLRKKTTAEDVVDGNITYKTNGDIYYTVNGTSQKVGERYELVIDDLESEDGEGYSGPLSIVFGAGTVKDLSNNVNDEKTITIGVDDPQNHPEHNTPVIVDVVNPVWKGPHDINTIQRTDGDDADTLDDDTVKITILGGDKYYASNTLATGKIKVYVDDVEKTTIGKELTQITDETQLQTLATNAGLSNIKVGYVLTLKSFGELNGKVKIIIDAGTITDTSGNVNLPTTILAGNVNWVETNEPLPSTDPNYPKYPAFSQDIVDFIDPEITYQYSAVTPKNPDIDYEDPSEDGDGRSLTVKFQVYDKYLIESELINADGTLNTTNLRIKVGGTDITDDLTTTITAEEITETVNGATKTTGYNYTLVVENFELVHNGNYVDYSGVVQLVFAESTLEDLSGNINPQKTITLDTDDGDDPDDGIIVDVIDPLIEKVEGTDLSLMNADNTIQRNPVTGTKIENATTNQSEQGTGTVTVYVKATDKYLSGGTLVDGDITTKIIKADGTIVTPDTINAVVTKESQDSTSIIYKIVLSNFEGNEGITSILIPADKITDTSNNGNQETEILVGNTGWTETGDNAATPEYPAFRESIIDVTRPAWDYKISSITRNRDGETGTVTIKILGSDTYYLKDTLTENDISVYVANSENPTQAITTISKDLVEITDASELNGVDVGYTLTLGNFGTYDGQVTIKITQDTMKDTSGLGNRTTEILVGNPNWVETDVEPLTEGETGYPKYRGFRNSVVDFIKPVITYQYEAGVNPVVNHTDKEVTIKFDVTDTNFLESTLGTGNIKVFADVGDLETDVTSRVTKSLTSESITNGIRYTLTLHQFELDEILENEEFKRHSGIIKLVIDDEVVVDTSGNKNIETTIIIDRDDGDDLANGIIVDFINPKIYFIDKFISWDQRYAVVTIRGTDRFYDFNTKLDPEDIRLYELNAEGEYIDITSIRQEDITIDSVETEYGYDFKIRLNNFEEEFKMKISIAGGKIADTKLGDEDIVRYNDATDIYVILDNKKPTWKYISTDTSEFEITEGSEETVEGKIKFTVRGQDKYLKLDESGLTIDDTAVDPEVKVFKDGVDITDYDNITINYLGSEDTLTRKSKTYEIVVEGLTEIGTYSLVFEEGTLKDEFGNTSATTTISFSKSTIASNTDNYTNITYHATPDYEIVHSAYVHELMSVNENGTNYESQKYRPSSIGEIHNDGKNTLFAEPFEYVAGVEGAEGVQAAESFAGWAEADENGNIIYYKDSTYAEVSPTRTAYYKLFSLYDDIPNTITNLKAVWRDATVIFVSSDETKASNSNDGLSPDTPVLDIETAYSKLSSSGTMENNVIVIMDAIVWNGTTTLSKNATITSLYAGVDYRATNGAELKITKNFVTNGDVQFDNIKLYADSTTVSPGTDYLAKGTYTNMLITNYGDVVLGRRITTPTDNYTFGAVVGGNFDTETTTGTIGVHRVIVEAGKYNNIIVGSTLNTQSSTQKYVKHDVIIGNMKDSAIVRNDKLTITGYLAMGEVEDGNYAYNPDGTQNTNLAYRRDYANVTLLSGTFTGTNKFTKTLENAAMYLRPIDGSGEGKVNFNMYGGNVKANIYAGSRYPTDNETATVNIMKFYGGEVNANIFGHGNDITSTGGSDITLSGIIKVNGNVFGGSNAGTIGYGKVTGNTKITVNSGTVMGSIYGGSNGSISGTTVNLNNGYITGNTTIIINAGSIRDDIYGSGYNCGNSGTTNITLNNGTISGSIYGGAYQNQVRTSSNINIYGGSVNSVYGGGKQETSIQLTADTIAQSVNIVIGDSTLETAPTVTRGIYGGGTFDKIGTTEIQLIKAENSVTVYGGSDSGGTTDIVNIYLKGITANEIYGGSQLAGTVGTANIYLESGTVGEVYGGGFNGTTTNTNIELEGTATVTTIYGGASSSGTVTNSNVILTSGTVTTVYGGGKAAAVTTATVTLDGAEVPTIYGGSKTSGEGTTTNVLLASGKVTDVFGGGLDVGVRTANVIHQGTAEVTNIYGGNNVGTGTGGNTTTTNVNVINSTVENVYGGNKGNGTSTGMTLVANVNIQGTSSITGKLYGGGYKSNIGASGQNGKVTINISGGTISGDVNGGSEQGVVYGETKVNIGEDAITNTLVNGNIIIRGNIYGAGSSDKAPNRDKQVNYNYDYVSLYGESHIVMDNSEDTPITFNKSIFGAGNGATYSNATDESTIIIRDFGTEADVYVMTSIERTGNVYIGNSVLELTGRQDIDNAYKRVSYSMNKITNALTIFDNTIIHNQRGYNQVGGFNSYATLNDDYTGTKATVTIDADTGDVTKNVDNRIYTLEGVNIIFAKEEGNIYADITRDIWGDVNGMTFFGMYTKDRTTGNRLYDIYDPDYTSGAVEDFFANGTYIEGRHKTNHETTVDGFYSNVAIFEEGVATVTTEYVGVTDYGTYYDWIVGAGIVNYQTTLIASTYDKEAIAELPLHIDYSPETTYTIDRISINALNPDIQLVDPLIIPTISADANNTFALTMETIKEGWYTSSTTNIYTSGGGTFAGDRTYKTDNSTNPGTLKFKVYNSVNITEQEDLGYVNVILTGKTKSNADGSQGRTFKVVISVNMQTIVEDQKAQYEPSFTDSTATNQDYTADSRVDLTYLLYKDVEEGETLYATGDYRVLSSTVHLPEGTKLTMKDYESGKIYYYHVTKDAVTGITYDSTEIIDGTTRYIYKLSNFIEMGSKNTSDNYKDDNSVYENETYVLEKYDISIDFIDSVISADMLIQETYLELRNSAGNIKYDNGRINSTETEITYDLYADEDLKAIKTHSIGSTKGSTYSVVTNTEIPITVETSFLQQKNDNGETVMDTKYYDKIGGLVIDIKDDHGYRPRNPELSAFKITNVNNSDEHYSADTATGVIRIPTTEGFTTMKTNYKLTLTQANVPAGEYTVSVYFFTSDDGKHHGGELTLVEEFKVIFVNRSQGLIAVEADNDSRIIEKETGKNLEGNNGVDMTVKVGDPTNSTNVRVKLYKRNTTYTVETDEATGTQTTTYNGISYTLVDISEYFEGEWTESVEGSMEYIISPKETYATPISLKEITFQKALAVDEDTGEYKIDTGEYKLEFTSYSDDIEIQTVRKTFVVTQ